MSPEVPPPSPDPVQSVRRFNRFYARFVGVLQDSFLAGPFSPTQARVLSELDELGTSEVGTLAGRLGLDAGYLSRLVGQLASEGLVDKRPSPEDRRVNLLALTKEGRDAFAALRQMGTRRIQEALAPLDGADRRRLIGSMETIEGLLEPSASDPSPYLLRPHQPGDLGWVVQQHGRVYAEEYNWSMDFEGLVAEIVAAFAKSFDPRFERCWIAERDGENIGSVFLVRESEEVARLRMLILDRRARGLGIGRRLVQECTRFARQVGYRSIVLWTDSILDAARHLYRTEGYRLVREEPHHDFGQDLIGEHWELTL